MTKPLTDGQEGWVSETRRDESSGTCWRIWQADSQSAWYPACIGLLVFLWGGAFTVMQHRLWHRRQRKQRRGCIGIDKVGPQSKKREVVDGWCPRHRNHSTQREGEHKKGFVSAPCRNVTYPQSQCLKKAGWFIFHSVNTHTFFRFFFYDAVLMTFFFFFYRLGDTFCCQSTWFFFPVKTHQKSFLSIYSFVLLLYFPPKTTTLFGQESNFALQGQSCTTKTHHGLALFYSIFILLTSNFSALVSLIQ